MTINIAILPEPKVQHRIFADAHWKQWEALGRVAINRLPGRPTPERVRSVIENADIAVTSWGCGPLAGEILDCAPRLRAVIHAAGTVKGIVTPELWERGIRVSSGNGELGRGVAETALGMTIASLKNMWRLTGSTRTGSWSEGKEQVRELYQVTIGVVGAGKAGGHFIKLLKQFHVDILVFDPGLTAEQAHALGATKTELDDLLTRSDVVSIHAPAIPATYRMINAERLARMKDDAILINTARGSIIDEAALLDQLRQGRLFACLDVTDPEPPDPDHPLRSLPNCVITPHLAGAVNNGAKRLGQFAIDEAKRLISGERLDGEVRPEQMSTMA
ncbi:hydroxyacid dehydrogenase [Paenibacillus hemerocallicola]|uniref:Hydroxyacid dehydrogenase n=1 Tax=Paenibacillus hemerocallicola TaxID=1172614 RepID=A0A5C4TFL4_9BACL|nr:hydroxyacid dehydrogenase [Paenibacillus hemerocallicola]TNJ67758.1 hydroxyacid dehydrogenase [Paenibacillus hemerocallicola]